MSTCVSEKMSNHHELTFLAGLGQTLHLWGDRWRQVEPLLFSSSDGRRRIGFMQDSSGAIVAVSSGSWRVLERAPH